MTTTTFEYEKTVLEALTAANIAGLQLRTSADVSDAQFKAIQKPTAVIALGDEVAVESNARAALAETQIFVYLVLRGATPLRTHEDGLYREAIFQALHGAQLPGAAAPAVWQSTATDYSENMRTYLMTFSVKHLREKLRR